MISSELTSLGSRLSSLKELMKDDFSGIKTELNTVSNRTNVICDKIGEHETKMTAKLEETRETLTKQIGGYTCGGTGGWRRAVYLDMTDPDTDCPPGWQLLTENSKRTCSRASTEWHSCDSVLFPVSGGRYNQVCGKIGAYQRGLTSTFVGSSYSGTPSIDDAYFSGVAVMHGDPRQHIWTYVAGARENQTSYASLGNCPCDSPYRPTRIPSFVGEDYFCESGYVWPGPGDTSHRTLRTNDTLWDGLDCHSSSTCCSLHNPPYFIKTLDRATIDDVKLRMCMYAGSNYTSENVGVEMVELYVKQDYTQTQLHEMDSKLKKSFSLQTSSISSLHVHTCGGTGGWRRAVYLDMTNPNTDCPPGWNVTGYAKRTCGRSNTSRLSCDSVFFPVSGGGYSRVCGRIRAYQWGQPDAFAPRRYRLHSATIDNAYVNGVGVMYGTPRQHIWTFAAGLAENDTRFRDSYCPCDTGDELIPAFVGDDYFCESAYVYPGYTDYAVEHNFHSEDTLWDGEDCHSSSDCCSLNDPPYFTKELSQNTTDDLELRICLSDSINFENLAVELVELFAQ